MDGRLKLFCLVVLSVAVGLATGWIHFLVLLGATVTALVWAKLPLGALLRDWRFFAVIGVVILVANAVFVPGEPLLPYFPLVEVSQEGLGVGLRFAGRLLLIVMVCSAVMGTTPISVLRDALEWCLRPVPFVPAARVAMMMNLTIVFVCVIMDNYAEMVYAQKSRCVESCRNPIKRMKFLALPLLTRTLQRTEEIVYAMESRCYSETRTQPIFTAHKADWGVAGACLGVLIFVSSG